MLKRTAALAALGTLALACSAPALAQERTVKITGFGATDCVDGTGTNVCKPAATEANLISGIVTPKLPVTVSIDGIAAPLVGNPQAPVNSVPGVLQINATVPTGAKAGAAVPVVVSVGTASSQAKVTMAVK